MRARPRVPDPKRSDAHATGRIVFPLARGASERPEGEPRVAFPLTRSIA